MRVYTTRVKSQVRSWRGGNTGCRAIGCGITGSIEETFPEHVDEVVDAKHRKMSIGSHSRINFRCPTCNEVSASKVANRVKAWRSGSTGCPCIGKGYKVQRPGWLYLIYNQTSGVLQIGITNNLDARLSTHRKNGFLTTVDYEHYADGMGVCNMETRLKKAVAHRIGHPLNARINGAKFDGFTESWPIDELSVGSLAELRAVVLKPQHAEAH
jgi:hypothetical protein